MIYPAGRTLALMLACMPVAYAVAALRPDIWWVGLIPVGALLLACVADLLFLRGIVDIGVSAPRYGEIGQPIEFLVTANVDPLPARCELSLEAGEGFALQGAAMREAEVGAGRAAARWTLTPLLRGPKRPGIVRLRRGGPLGLVWRQKTHTPDTTIGIIEDISAIRSPAVQHMLRDAQIGIEARTQRGEGREFNALVEYAPGMDRRAIDWKRSAHHTSLVAREYRTERNNQIVFAVDCGRSMIAPLDGIPRLDRAISAALVAAYAALKIGDKAAFYAFASRPEQATPFVRDTREFARLQRAAADVEYRHQETNFILGLTALGTRLQQRSMIIIFSEFSDEPSAHQMSRVARRLLDRHLVLFVSWDDLDLTHAMERVPDSVEDISKSVTAHRLVRERRAALQRLRQVGVRVLEGSHKDAPVRLVDAYLRMKREAVI